MKKILTILSLVSGIVLSTSCNLDKYPETAINTDEAMESAADCYNFLTGLRASTKSLYSGFYCYATDFMTDSYHAIKNYGNWDGDYLTYNIQASDSNIETVWNNFYAYIGNANFLIAGTGKLLESETLSADDESLVKSYYGEACFLRALMYFKLTEYFCVAYDKETAASVFGVPVVTVYAPTGDSGKYPHRGTLQATYDQIALDIAEAEANVAAAGSQNSGYVTADVVKAFKARFSLSAQDYTTAFSCAKDIIDSETYTFAASASEFKSGWINDNLSETIWQPIILDASDGGSANSYFIYNTSGEDGDDDPQYLPEDWVLMLYDQTNDMRWSAYFEQRHIDKRGNNGDLTLLIKFPGNPALNSSSASHYINRPKIFRLGEIYLIAAEAAYESGDETAASNYLNELKKYRIAHWSSVSYSGESLKQEIRNERVRELFGEGFRLSDIKRWHIGFSRSEGQNPALLQTGPNYTELSMPADSPRFVWPIPTSEMSANPQMKGEQNEGYTQDTI